LVSMADLLWHRIVNSVVWEFRVQTVHLFPILSKRYEKIFFKVSPLLVPLLDCDRR
jgi:hypothetical protein